MKKVAIFVGIIILIILFFMRISWALQEYANNHDVGSRVRSPGSSELLFPNSKEWKEIISIFFGIPQNTELIGADGKIIYVPRNR